MADRYEKGSLGEQFAADYLVKQKYTVLSRNYKKKQGELDIIARKGEVIAVVEVKTRKTGSLRRGVLAVDTRKRLRIIRTTQIFLLENEIDISGVQIRFDIAEIVISDEEEPRVLKINYFENAFDATGIDDFLFI